MSCSPHSSQCCCMTAVLRRPGRQCTELVCFVQDKGEGQGCQEPRQEPQQEPSQGSQPSLQGRQPRSRLWQADEASQATQAASHTQQGGRQAASQGRCAQAGRQAHERAGVGLRCSGQVLASCMCQARSLSGSQLELCMAAASGSQAAGICTSSACAGQAGAGQWH